MTTTDIKPPRHFVSVRMYRDTKKADSRVVDIARQCGGKFDDLSDKGPIFSFPATGNGAQLFRETIRNEGLGYGFETEEC